MENTIGSGGRDKALSVVNAIAKKDYESIFAAVDDVFRSSRDITVFWQEKSPESVSHSVMSNSL